MKKIIINSFIVVFLAACGDQSIVTKNEIETTPLVSGIDTSHFDTSVRPQDDLFRHINGKWLDEFEIPGDKSNYGSFTKLGDQAREDVKAIIEEASQSNAEQGTDAQKVGDLYKSFMNVALLDEKGTTTLEPELAKIDAINNLSDMSDYLAYAQMISGAPFYTYVYITLMLINTEH